MSLSLKYLVPINLLIIAIWVAHFIDTRSALEDAVVATEAEAMAQLSHSLRIDIEAALAHGETVSTVASKVAALGARWSGLEVMVIEPSFRVVVATHPDRIGELWYEPAIASVLDGLEPSSWNLDEHRHQGRRAIDASVPVLGPNGEMRYVVHTAKLLDRLAAATRQQRQHDLYSAVAELAAVTVVVNLLTVLLVLRPLSRIRRRIARSGWLDAHPKAARKDEIVHLGVVVDALLDQVEAQTETLRSSLGATEDALQSTTADRDHLASRVERVRGALADTEERLRRAERMAAMAQLSGALAHELRNPLHIIRATAETTVSVCPEAAELAEDIKEEVDRVDQLLSRLLEYTRPSDLQLQPVDVSELLSEVRARMCRGHCSREPSTCALCPIVVAPDAATVEGDPVLLGQAVMNLMTNARELSPSQTVIELSALAIEPSCVDIVVADRGPGLPDEDRGHATEPFFSRKPGGTGLGLAVVQRIADLHGGSITLEPRDGGGTVARFRLPTKGTP